MMWVFNYIFEAFPDCQAAEAMLGGQSSFHFVPQFALQPLQLPGNVGLMDAEQPGDLSELQSILIPPQQHEPLSRRQTAACRSHRVLKGWPVAERSKRCLDVVLCRAIG